MKTCKCGNETRKGQRYCRECHAAHMREWRKKNPMTPEQREKDNARSYAGTYLRRGKLQRQPCQECGSENAEMHHPDYGRPLYVEWMCRDCHLAHHKAEVEKRQKSAESADLNLRKLHLINPSA